MCIRDSLPPWSPRALLTRTPRRRRYIPHLPLELFPSLQAPVPFLIGVYGDDATLAEALANVDASGEGVVVVDLDADAIRVAGGALRLPDGAARDDGARALRELVPPSPQLYHNCLYVVLPHGVKARSAPGGGGGGAPARFARFVRGQQLDDEECDPSLDLDGSRSVAPRAAAAPRRRKLNAYLSLIHI